MDITVKELLKEKELFEKDITDYVNNRKAQFSEKTGLEIQSVTIHKLQFGKWPDYEAHSVVDIYDQPIEVK